MSSTKSIKVAGVIKQDSAVGLYRIGQPTQFIDKVSKEKSRITPFTGKGRHTRISNGGDPNIEAWGDKTLMGICGEADILWSTIIYDRDEMVKMLDIRKWSGAKWIVDIDDDLYSIPVDNPNKRSTEALRSEAELCLSLADGVTVSVPRLKAVYKHLNPNIYVNPNGQDIDFWKKLPKSHNITRKLRIGWRGAMGHGADTSLIEPALKELAKNYKFELVTLGAKPSFKTEHHEWVGCLEYPQALAKLDLDIALVPLIDSPYNQAKSNIAVQEFSMLKIPVVASPVENQLNMPISYARTNFIWYNEIEKLLKDRKLRQKQGLEQYNFVKYHYDVKKLTPELMEFFKNLERKEI